MPAYQRTGGSAYDSAYRGALYAAVGGGFIGRDAANLFLSVLATYVIVGTKLIKCLARTGQYQRAGAGGHGGAAAEQKQTD